MVTMATIQPASAFFANYGKNVVKTTQFQMLPETTIFTFKALNFVRSWSVEGLELWG